MRASSRALVHALALVALAAGQHTPFYVMISAYTDANCTAAATGERPQVYDVNNMEHDPQIAALQAMGTGCIMSGAYYVHIQDCMILTYTNSDCTGDPVAAEELSFEENCEFSPGDGEYYAMTCQTEVAPATEATDLTCWEQFASEEFLGEWPECTATCGAPPATCEEANSRLGQCAVGCSEEDLRAIGWEIQLMFGCGCLLHGVGGDGAHGPTCGDVREAYRRNDCCGNPNRPFHMDEGDHDAEHRRLTERSRRRLTKRPTPWARPSLPKVPTPLGLPDVDEEDVQNAALVHSITRRLARAKSSGGARRARDMAAEIKAALRPYMSQGAVGAPQVAGARGTGFKAGAPPSKEGPSPMGQKAAAARVAARRLSRAGALPGKKGAGTTTAQKAAAGRAAARRLSKSKRSAHEV